MRAVIIRFIDCEGPGILEPILREKGYRISYQNAFDSRVQLMPEIHLNFDLIIMLGGPQSVADPDEQEFFKPYYEIVENVAVLPNKKLIGICLGSQIIARALGANVRPGTKGPETGFSDLQILKPEHPIFSGLNIESILAFHLHEDIFDIPVGAEHLLASEFYANQMFSYKNKIFAFQTHLEPTLEMLDVWQNVHKEFIAKGTGDFSNLKSKQKTMEESAKILFRNIINL
ncbi:type 1 glutamine amidotransferase [Leptospira biflexa]|uniref:type 1 glutamine amidotransferase n=1 Tax=Leptospira biflexa TaxID=172 RepID=UPI00108426A4|nr:type 1 glutamine amidotransferase [Leptospira biflexa]TGM31787.1 type 1 glutamine amidotransferase [Leptospira biflexa]TGM36929.1 type 1 glutamine amidotransferase [Leptospira biflexa]TGM46465.1 type 1 glutamine amidotransferase [Leptospira biflexa]TGM51073.1 type 1 glutamine amidotransferase [Leptospira biflexa]TGM56337.1 type 1 glutamine amidotransferase [Leptospira biflexa]